jgi:hypothetical protein
MLKKWTSSSTKPITLYAQYIEGQPIYRLRNPNVQNAGSHFYTDSKVEGTSLVNAGWKWDNNKKPVFYAYKSQRTGSIQTYRMYCDIKKGCKKYEGDHMYVPTLGEKKTLQRQKYTYESPRRFYVEPTKIAKLDYSSTPMYLLTNPNTGEHFYTTDKKEYDNVAKAGWHKTGTPFFVVFSS